MAAWSLMSEPGQSFCLSENNAVSACQHQRPQGSVGIWDTLQRDQGYLCISLSTWKVTGMSVFFWQPECTSNQVSIGPASSAHEKQ